MTPPDRPIRIGELADRAGINTKTIRYYESIGLLPEPARTPSGYRTYLPDEVGRLVFIRSAQRLGLSLDEIREVLALRDRGDRPCGYVLEVVSRELAALDQRIAEMVALREELSALLDGARTAPVPTESRYCSLIEHRAAKPLQAAPKPS